MDEFAYQLNPGTDPERVKSCTLESLLKLRSSRPCSYRLDSETIILSKSRAEASQETVLDILRAFDDKWFQTTSLPSRIPRLFAKATWSRKGVRKPVVPSITESQGPGTFQPTTGVPTEFASITEIPNPSRTEGKTAARDLERSSNLAFSEIPPRNSTFRSIP